MSKDAGGTAFPVSIPGCGDNGQSGMTLRDYFATHADQPGALEIISAAGLRCEDNFWIAHADGTRTVFTKWYEAMTQAERFALHAKVRFQLADAMLAERSKS